MGELRIAIVRFGKIARDQHVRAIEATPGAALVAVASSETERQIWDIHVETDQGGVTLSAGGARLKAGDERLVDTMKEEYPLLYRRFVELASEGRSDVDLAPLQLVADAFMLGRRRQVEAFEDRT